MGRPRKAGPVTYGAMRYRAIQDGTWHPMPHRDRGKQSIALGHGFRAGHTVNTGRRTPGYMKPGLEPMEHPTLHQLYWAAGVFEGEGSCQGAIGGNRTTIVKIGQKDRWLCDRLRALFGGSVKFYSGHRAYRSINRRNEFYYWIITGVRARGFLMTMFSVCSPRRRLQIQRALAA